MAISVVTERELRLRNLLPHFQIGGVGPNESIYKYVSLDNKRSWNYFEQMIQDAQLIGSTTNSLNDPFEAKPRVIDNITEEVMRECSVYYDKGGTICESPDLDRFSSSSEFSVKVRGSLEKLISNTRILSFCRRSDSPLLWSHYANSHQGACIHFSANAFPTVDLTKGAVTYSRHRPVVPLSLPGKIILAGKERQHPEDRADLRRELFQQCFFVKPLDWSYEEEVRILYNSNKMTNVGFNLGGLFEIIIGSRASEETVNRIRNLARSANTGIAVRQAFIDEDTFSVGIR